MLPIILGGTGLILASLYMQGPTNNVSVRSTLDNKEYKVQNLPDKQEASNLLGSLALKLEKLVNIIKTEGYENIYTNM